MRCFQGRARSLRDSHFKVLGEGKVESLERTR